MREELKSEILNRIDLYVSNSYGRRLQNLPEYIAELERGLERKEAEVKDIQSKLDSLSQLTDAEVIDKYLSMEVQNSFAIRRINICRHMAECGKFCRSRPAA